VFRTLIESWNGSTWTIATSPNNGTGYNHLSAISCVSAISCTAVGEYSGTTRTLIESWDGAVWSLVASPNRGTGNNFLSALYGVSCVSASSCSAVGEYLASLRRTLIEAWDGSAWRLVASPNKGSAITAWAGCHVCRPPHAQRSAPPPTGRSTERSSSHGMVL